MAKGCVYFLRGGGLTKIGRTGDLRLRLQAIRSCSPARLELLFAVYCDDPKHVEDVMHAVFDQCRKHGEWFRLTYTEVMEVAKHFEEDGEEDWGEVFRVSYEEEKWPPPTG
jgi:hypothetical protein